MNIYCSLFIYLYFNSWPHSNWKNWTWECNLSWSYKLDYETDEMIKEICVWCGSRNLEFWNWFGWLNWVITWKYKAVYRADKTFIIGQNVADHFLYKFAFYISMNTKFSLNRPNMRWTQYINQLWPVLLIVAMWYQWAIRFFSIF